jgi:hypothetical protein
MCTKSGGFSNNEKHLRILNFRILFVSTLLLLAIGKEGNSSISDPKFKT